MNPFLLQIWYDTGKGVKVVLSQIWPAHFKGSILECEFFVERKVDFRPITHPYPFRARISNRNYFIIEKLILKLRFISFERHMARFPGHCKNIDPENPLSKWNWKWKRFVYSKQIQTRKFPNDLYIMTKWCDSLE